MATTLEREASTHILPDALLYIDGQMRPAEGGKTFDNISPWTAEKVGVAADASRADVEAAIVAARRAFDETDWSTNHEKRYALVRKLHELFVANKHRLSDLARHEAGAGLVAVNRAHVDMALDAWSLLMDSGKRVPWR